MHYVTETVLASSECSQIKTHKACLACHECFSAGHRAS